MVGMDWEISIQRWGLFLATELDVLQEFDDGNMTFPYQVVLSSWSLHYCISSCNCILLVIPQFNQISRYILSYSIANYSITL